MNKSFEYLYTIQASGSIDIEDIGNCCLHAFNDLGFEWYLIIYSELGDTVIKELGPFNTVSDELNIFRYGFYYTCESFSYNEKKISSIIDKFINDRNKGVSQVFECEPEEAYNKLNNINFEEMR